MNLQDPNLMVALFAIGMGLSGALIAWLISQAVAAVPAEDREFKDKPPLGFRLVWWPVQWVGHYLGVLIPPKTHAAVLGKLRRAGLDFTINPQQYLAARLIGALVVAGTAHWIVSTFAEFGTGDVSVAAQAQAVVAGALCGWLYPAIWLRDRLQARRRELVRALPFCLDIVTLCVEAGLTFQAAMAQTVDKGPTGPLRDELQRVLRDIRAGRPRAEALRLMAERLNEPSISNFVSAVIQAESMGMNLGPVLRAQADQRRTERFLRAEKLAMEAPVKMLFPLIAFIFPCTFIVLFFPIVMQFMHTGL